MTSLFNSPLTASAPTIARRIALIEMLRMTEQRSKSAGGLFTSMCSADPEMRILRLLIIVTGFMLMGLGIGSSG